MSSVLDKTISEKTLMIAELAYADQGFEIATEDDGVSVFVGTKFGTEGIFDYYHNWSDLMPLVLEYDITYVKANTPADYQEYSVMSTRIMRQPTILTSKKDLQEKLADCLLLALLAEKREATKELHEHMAHEHSLAEKDDG